MFSAKKWPLARLAGWALILGALILYLATLDNGLAAGELVGGDLITHQYAQVQARPSNAPGYPLYTMGGWLWFHSGRALLQALGNPLPNPISILSSYSTLWALLALWLLYHILLHSTRSTAQPTGEWPLAALLTIFYAVTRFFWYYATTTEQYTSAVAQTLAIVYLFLLWQDGLSITNYELRITNSSPFRAQRAPAHSAFHILLLALLCGVALAHMLTVAFIVPPLVLVILWQRPSLLRSPTIILGCIGMALLPLVSYGYVYLRGAAHPEWWGQAGDWQTAGQWFWSFVGTSQGRQELGWGLEAGRAFWGNGFPELIWQELSLPLLVIGLVGIAWLKRPLAVLLYGTLAIYILFCWLYRYGNWFQVILPAYPLVLLGVAGLGQGARGQEAGGRGQGAGGKGQEVRCKGQGAGGRRQEARGKGAGGQIFLYGCLVIAIGWRVSGAWPAVNSHNRPGDSALDHAARLLAQPLPAGAKLFAAVDDALALQYLSNIWQARPDVQVVSSAEAGRLLSAGQPVFATWPATPALRAELPPALQPSIESASADWVRLQVGAQTTPTQPAVRLERVISPLLTLMGYTITSAPGPVTQPATSLTELDVALFWRVNAPDWPVDVAISVRPTRQGAFLPDPASTTGGLLQQDVARPAHGLLDLTGIPTGEPVQDSYRLSWPPPSEADGVMVIVYRNKTGGFENVAEILLPVQIKQ